MSQASYAHITPYLFLLALSLLTNLFFFVTSQEQQPAPAQALGDDLNNQLMGCWLSHSRFANQNWTISKSKQSFAHLRLGPQLKHLQLLFELNQFDRLVAEWESLLTCTQIKHFN